MGAGFEVALWSEVNPRPRPSRAQLQHQPSRRAMRERRFRRDPAPPARGQHIHHHEQASGALRDNLTVGASCHGEVRGNEPSAPTWVWTSWLPAPMPFALDEPGTEPLNSSSCAISATPSHDCGGTKSDNSPRTCCDEPEGHRQAATAGFTIYATTFHPFARAQPTRRTCPTCLIVG